MELIADAVIHQLGQGTLLAYNPVYFHSSNALMISNSMSKIEHTYRRKYPNAQITHLDGYYFTNLIVQSIISGSESYNTVKLGQRNSQLYLFENLQGIAGKNETQEEFYVLFDILRERGCQIVIGASRLPQYIEGLWPRILSQMQQGLIVGL